MFEGLWPEFIGKPDIKSDDGEGAIEEPESSPLNVRGCKFRGAPSDLVVKKVLVIDEGASIEAIIKTVEGIEADSCLNGLVSPAVVLSGEYGTLVSFEGSGGVSGSPGMDVVGWTSVGKPAIDGKASSVGRITLE